MSNAMKKLKLLHHLTAASANATASTSSIPPPPASAQQFPTPPTSPIRHHFHPQSQAYLDVSQALRSARHALNSIQSPAVIPQGHQYHTQADQLMRNSHYAAMVQQPPRPSGAPTCLLPQAFMVLTPNDPHPAICLPASPPPVTSHMHNHYHHHSTLIPPVPINAPIQQVLSEQAVPRGNNTIYSSRPPLPAYQGASHYQYHTSRRPSAHKRPRLTTDAVSKIGKDSRLARWERVVSYVREQRKASAASQADTTPEDPSLSALEAKRAFIREIERKNHLLDLLDYDEQERRSLWSGGSAGTNGVDEFVWSEDDDDDSFRKTFENQHAIEEHKRRLDRLYPEDAVKQNVVVAAPAEEGVFTLEDGEATVKDFEIGNGLTRSSPRSEKRPRSSPAVESNAYWEKLKRTEIEKLPELRRESQIEGGLDRLAGREMRRFSIY